MQKIIIGTEKISLGKKLGGGNEGDVYRLVGRPNLAVKVYKEGNRRSREEKIRSMVSAGLGQKTKLVAFPLDVAKSLTGEFLGFSMRLMSGRQLHELYTPKSRLLQFPNSDYRFLIRVALNVARAAGTVHNLKRCVIGDLNQNSILVAGDATVVLIDADSFQFSASKKTFRCVVGVPDFTPPELHGKRFEHVKRTIAHDNFALAVAIFYLLFMGHHPYAGRGGPDTLGEAIAQNRFAYSIERKAETKTTPPLRTLTLDQFPKLISRRFEEAFGLTPAKRPDARAWMEALASLECALVQCKDVNTHYYPSISNNRKHQKFTDIISSGLRRSSTVTGCVWCGLAHEKKLDMFPAQSAVVPNIQANAPVADGEKSFVYFGGLRARLFALGIDLVFLILVLLAILLSFDIPPESITTLLSVLVFPLLYWTITILYFNSTIGMRLFGLRVLRIDGNKCVAWQAIARYFVCFLPYAFLSVGQMMNVAYPFLFSVFALVINAIFIGIRKDKRGLNDLICGTMVSQEIN